MLNADCAPYFHTCPRCGIGGFERLATHNHCVGCNYSEVTVSDEFLSIPQWAFDVLKTVKPKSTVRKIREEDYEFENAV